MNQQRHVQCAQNVRTMGYDDRNLAGRTRREEGARKGFLALDIEIGVGLVEHD